MKRSNRLIILVGVLLAVLAFVGIVVVLNQDGGGGTGDEPETVAVLEATEDIAIGDPVTPEKAEVVQVEVDAAAQTRIGATSLLTGRPALVPIPVGTQITQEMVGLGTQPSVNIEAALEPGEKAIAFQVDPVTGLNFLITPGDRIDVVVTQEVTPLQETQDSIDARANDPQLQPRYEAVPGVSNVRTVKTILQDRRVLYVSGTNVRQVQTGAPAEGEEQPAAEAQTLDTVIIVFAGSDQDAEVVKFAQRADGDFGTLTAILRRTEDTAEEVPNEETTGITLDILVEEYGVPVPDIVLLEPQQGNGQGNN